MPQAKWRNRSKRGLTGDLTALPYGTSYQTYRNPGSRFRVNLDGADSTRIAPHTGTTHWYAGYQSQFDSVLNVDSPVAGGQTLDFWSWDFIEEGWDYGFVEALVNGQWRPSRCATMRARSSRPMTTRRATTPRATGSPGPPAANTSSTSRNTSTSQAQLPAGATDVRFPVLDGRRLSGHRLVRRRRAGSAEPPQRPSPRTTRFQTTGEQDNHWSLQIIAPCDLNGASTANEATDGAGNYVYRFDGDSITTPVYSAKCAGKEGIVTVVSNLPTGDLQYLDAPYEYALVSNPK